MTDSRRATRALVVVSLGVLLSTSTWFTGTAAARELAVAWTLSASRSAWLTSATQWGFIAGTLFYAITNLADRYDARHVFAASAILGAGFNLGFAWASSGLAPALAFRFATGLTLAGVYPVGMKLIAGWFQRGLGWRLGIMVGCLTLGTAFPYGVIALELELDWRVLASVASVAAALGGLLVALACEEGPHLRARASFDIRVIGRVFRHRPFRDTAFGYFGHMWELYALWSMTGFWLAARPLGPSPRHDAGLAFATVAVGAIGCVGGGLLSRRLGERRVAMAALLLSATACIASGWVFVLPDPIVAGFLLVWGVVVVADSPQFSALAAGHAPAQYVGTALTVQNGIGFLVTIGSIQLLPRLADVVGWRWSLCALALGPLLGAVFTARIPDPTAPSPPAAS